MSARSRARRARAGTAPPAESAAPVAGVAPPAPASRPPFRLRLPLLPLLAAAIGAALLLVAWSTRWTPGAPAAVAQATRFTLAIPADRQRVIDSWERFFICYELTDPAIVDLTLRANQRATGSLDFPREQVIVELPASGAPAAAERPAAGDEDALLAARNAVLGAAVPERLAAVRRQCGG